MKPFSMVTVLALFFLAMPLAARAAEDNSEPLDPEEMAARSHGLAVADVMNSQEDFRALYYQNSAIIQLLKEIRDEMHALNLRDAKTGGKT